MDQDDGRRALRFVITVVLVTFLAVAAVLVFNVIFDPYATVGTHLFPTVATSDRTVKADKIERLKQQPQLVVLGSSRSMRYEPTYLEEKTGLSTFNAGVNGIGGTADAWAMTQFIHEVWPEARPNYLWLVDVESFVPFEIGGRTANERRLAKYVAEASAGKGAAQMGLAIWQNRTTILSLATTKDSMRLLLYREKAKSKQSRYRKQIQADGSVKERKWSEKEWSRRYPRSVERYGALYRDAYKGMDGTAESYLEKTLEFMNAQGAKPLIVLTPINPKLRKILGPLGWETRHKQVAAYLRSLQKTYDFVFLDLTDPRDFGFNRREWYDGVHLTTVNTRLATDYIFEQTGGVPPVAPAGAE